MDQATAYIISIGAAFLLAAIYFFYTYRNQRCYYEDEVEEMNRTRTRI